MIVSLLVIFACFAGGIMVAAQWLPPLATGLVGGFAFVSVVGLLGAALTQVGLSLYLTVRELHHLPSGLSEAEVFAVGVRNAIDNGGLLFGLACAVFLLAPRDNEPDADADQAQPQTQAATS
jgi:hypothetical protein